MEVDKIEKLLDIANSSNYKKISDYLVASSHYSPDTEDYLKNLTIAHDLCINNGDLSNALRISIKMDDPKRQTPPPKTKCSYLCYLTISDTC